MITCKCIQKFRERTGKIYGYRLIDINGQTQDATPGDLKRAIANKNITVLNLTLTSDDRLVDKNPEKQLQNKKIMPNNVIRPMNNKEKFIDYITKVVEGLTKRIGTGDIQIEPDECTDDYLMGTIYNLCYDKNDDTYVITFGISDESEPEVYAIFQKDCMNTPEFEDSMPLKKPIESKENLVIIKEFFDTVAKKVEEWQSNNN